MTGIVTSEIILGILKDRFTDENEESLSALALFIQNQPAKKGLKIIYRKMDFKGGKTEKKPGPHNTKTDTPKKADQSLVPFHIPLLTGKAGPDRKHLTRPCQIKEV